MQLENITYGHFTFFFRKESCFLTVDLFFLSVTQTPFTFGVNQRAPYTTGDRCLLCRSERKDAISQDIGGSSQNGAAQSPKSSSALQLPLYVCSDCKRTVEKDDRQPSLDQSLLVRFSFLQHLHVSPLPLVFKKKKKT